jgi:hypothetical protein
LSLTASNGDRDGRQAKNDYGKKDQIENAPLAREETRGKESERKEAAPLHRAPPPFHGAEEGRFVQRVVFLT